MLILFGFTFIWWFSSIKVPILHDLEEKNKCTDLGFSKIEYLYFMVFVRYRLHFVV